MVKRGKRAFSQRENNEDNRYQKRRVSFDKDEKISNDELVAYRILCPDGVIGSVIGKSGKVINAIRQETRARIKVLDPFPGCSERVIAIYCSVKEKKEIDIEGELHCNEPLCSAQDALLKVHEAIVNSLATAAENIRIERDDKKECRILVPSSQSSNVIGKAGSTIKRIRSKTRATVKVVSKDASEPMHSCAMDFDNFVLISGEPESVKKALSAISAIMYKFSPREQIPLDTIVQEVPASIIIPSDVSIYPQTSLYQNQDPILQHRAGVPALLGSLPVSDLQGCAETSVNQLPVFSSGFPVVPGFGGPARSEELILKVLCPFPNIGRVIGKGGSTIKGIRQASGAHIEVNDTKTDRDECLITITATESPDDLKSMAVESILLLQEKINDEDEENVKMRLLVPSKVIGCIIGKSGSIISEIRKTTRADIHISKGSKPKCADTRDELVEVSGEVSPVRDALIQIVLRLRDDVLRDRDGSARKPSAASDNNLFSGSTAGLAVPSLLPSAPQVAPLGFDRRPETGSGFGVLPSGGLYGYGCLPTGENGFGSIPSYSSKFFEGLSQPTLEILIPANAVGKVMGKRGANLVNIRTISGAMIEISDSKSSHGDRIALISGTPEQKHTAERLVQAFIMAT
ncbi:PREDICTED: KH domain-containing protein At4g18375-like [Tarenaya hassleriana]|uniref:KH domain-containing protein At4g18375-like n=1 Tax=Tarenaya hassleriana TaxID=28532 RepID=UPI00053C4717|nr:PREDICTED: KH domain-containing protein At4g18375-like [Tarenaya hassleriana]XP_010529162.1 PREDICTED: KH domain-containing protein At4g18375-like [Tarenaya hassleriana]XP_010529163.1 PREDICTED: KH domain-containing protein At4g18375-like [Tarenaya hassleriana]XP_010529164.1 PREDICTED: KH domain-containing protein At4g18375-like [Tarenaya hassleriana]XP_010529165.1 PREDICTED: KH domain-containing protein At4g18375-like [Tarenaya hassleriana]